MSQPCVQRAPGDHQWLLPPLGEPLVQVLSSIEDNGTPLHQSDVKPTPAHRTPSMLRSGALLNSHAVRNFGQTESFHPIPPSHMNRPKYYHTNLLYPSELSSSIDLLNGVGSVHSGDALHYAPAATCQPENHGLALNTTCSISPPQMSEEPTLATLALDPNGCNPALEVLVEAPAGDRHMVPPLVFGDSGDHHINISPPRARSLSNSSGSHCSTGDASPGTSPSWAEFTPSGSSDAATPESVTTGNGSQSIFGARSESGGTTTTIPGCSKDWVVAKKKRKRRGPNKNSNRPRTPSRIVKSTAQQGSRRRKPFRTAQLRQETAMTRINQGCMRCRLQRIRCVPNESDPTGSCETCVKVKGLKMCQLPCLRWKITNSSLHREQKMPYQMFSKRWQSMDIVDIPAHDWASTELKTIVLSQIYLDAPYVVRVREFKPVEGDMLEEKWTTDGVTNSHKIPRYALANMNEVAAMMDDFVERSVYKYIIGTTDHDELLWNTYLFAFRYMGSLGKENRFEKELLAETFKFWVGCRKTSNPEHIYGKEKLGGEVVGDPKSPFYNVVPMPVIMIAQMECIMYTNVLEPLQKKILYKLNALVQDNKPKNWLTIYLTIFILFHSCSLLSQRDRETAQQYDLPGYANFESIRSHQAGMNTVLAHFHYLNKGFAPFKLCNNENGLQELSRMAQLDEEQLNFVRETSALVNEPWRASVMNSVLEGRVFNHHLYWVAQLFNDKWKPGPTV